MRRRTLLTRLAGFGAATLIGSCGQHVASQLSGGRVRRIGYLSGNARSSVELLSRPLLQRLSDLGYVEGRDFVVDYRIADNATERLPAMAAELAALPVDVIFAEGGAAHFAAQAATSTIPIVLGLGPDPDSSGLVQSLARPGGNVTGISQLNNAVMAKRLELLKETVPALTRVAVIHNANNKTIDSAKHAQLVGPGLGLDVGILGARDVTELDGILARIAESRYEAIMTTALLSVVRTDHGRIPEFAARFRMPQVFADVEIARAGGFMFYGPSFAALYRTAARMVDKILQGAKPADLPVEGPTQFDLAINLTMAKRIGVTFPQSVLRQATEVIP